MTFTITHEYSFPAPRERVFEALTDPAELSHWFAEHAEITPVPGGSYRFWGRHTLGTRSRGDATQSVTDYLPQDTIGFTWTLNGVRTDVRMRLRSRDAGTRLLLEHRVNGDLGVARQQELIDDHWRMAMSNLSVHLTGAHGLQLPDFDEPEPAVRHIVRIDAPPSVVFRALIEPQRVNRWFATSAAVIEPRTGGRYDLGWTYKVNGRDVSGGPKTILEIVSDERLVLDWPDWRGDADVQGQTITFELQPNGLGGTTLTFTHAGFARVTDMSDYGVGWMAFLDALRKDAML